MSVARPIVVVLTLALAGCASKTSVQTTTTSPSAPVTTTARPAAVLIPSGTGNLAAMASPRGFTLRDRPGGKVVAHLRPTTTWGSPTVVWAAKRRGDWLGVVSTVLENNQVAWLDARRDHPRMWRTRLSLHADLSARTLELRRGARVVRRMSVGVGSPDTPTPVGRFSVTDKLVPDRSLSYYGCCLLALSGRQAHLRPGWAGGDRIAIHGGSTGGAASAGCLHASDADLRHLMKLIPIGTPVYINA
jgi:hypothetical protein